ncbi:hypothetical protein GGF46_000836 [Coemansia sp. RSA 552]|nr:hypothetical protein GGF46_000836 [Coemansia sp. RSA 552]
MSTATSSGGGGGSSEQQALRLYELETEVSQQREAKAQAQTTIEQLEKSQQRALDELEALHKAHGRLEARFFDTEAELAAAKARSQRTQRTAASLEASLEAKTAALDREREAWQRKEGELKTELAQAKRKALVGRRQTVSAASPVHSRTGSTVDGRMSMYAPGSSSPLSPPSSTHAIDADDTGMQMMQSQIRHLTRRLKEAEARAQHATEQAARIHMEAEQTVGDLDSFQRQAEKLESQVRQLSELNESLREDNESYQVLLQMTTIKGGLSFNNPRSSLDSRASSGKWAASPTILEDGPPTMPSTCATDSGEVLSPGGGLDLASELGQVLSLDDGGSDGDSLLARISELEEQATQLKEDLRKTKYARRHLSEENKALSLYVNKILDRILSSGGLEAVLSHDYDPAKKQQPSTFATPRRTQTTPRHARHNSARLVRKTFTSPQPPPPPSLALFSEPGTGDGITSVFVPPASPAALRTSGQQLPADATSPPPFSRRVRSATVAVSSSNSSSSPADDPSAAGAATIGGASGTWWKRMSIRLGGTGWNPPDENQDAAPQ